MWRSNQAPTYEEFEKAILHSCNNFHAYVKEGTSIANPSFTQSIWLMHYQDELMSLEGSAKS
jgi:hypothetical protein